MSPCCDRVLEIAHQSFGMTLQLMMKHHNTKFGNKMFRSLEDVIWININIFYFAVTLTLKAVILFFHSTFWLRMMYHQTKFGCQRISSSEDIDERVMFSSYEPSLWPWPWRLQTFFSHNTLVYDTASPYQVWWQNILWFRSNHPDKPSLTFWTFALTLTFSVVTKYLHRTLRLTMLYC